MSVSHAESSRTRGRLAALLLALAVVLPSALAALPGDGEKVHVRVEPGERRVERQIVRVAPGEVLGPMFVQMLGRGFLGVELINLTAELRAHFGAPEDAGVLVARVAPDSPAAAAGIQVGDVITRVGEEKVESAFDLARQVRQREAGETVSIDLVRARRARSLDVTITERDREAVDVGRFFQWQGEEEGSPMRLHLLKEGESPGLLRFSPELFEGLGERLEAIDWSEVSRRAHGSSPELEKRIEELEARLEKLQKELEKALQKKP